MDAVRGVGARGWAWNRPGTYWGVSGGSLERGEWEGRGRTVPGLVVVGFSLVEGGEHPGGGGLGSSWRRRRAGVEESLLLYRPPARSDYRREVSVGARGRKSIAPAPLCLPHLPPAQLSPSLKWPPPPAHPTSRRSRPKSSSGTATKSAPSPVRPPLPPSSPTHPAHRERRRPPSRLR